MPQPWVKSLLSDVGARDKPRRHGTSLQVNDVIDRIAVLCMTGHLFEDDSAVVKDILSLARSVSSNGDVDLDKIRSFARSAGDGTITAEDAILVIRQVAVSRVNRK